MFTRERILAEAASPLYGMWCATGGHDDWILSLTIEILDIALMAMISTFLITTSTQHTKQKNNLLAYIDKWTICMEDGFSASGICRITYV